MNIRQKALIGIASLLLAWSGWKGLNALMISAPLPGLQTGKGEATMPPKVQQDGRRVETVPDARTIQGHDPVRHRSSLLGPL